MTLILRDHARDYVRSARICVTKEERERNRNNANDRSWDTDIQVCVGQLGGWIQKFCIGEDPEDDLTGG